MYSQYQEFLSVGDVRELADVEAKLERELEKRDFIIQGLEAKNVMTEARLRALEDREKQRAVALTGEEDEADVKAFISLLKKIEANPEWARLYRKNLEKIGEED